MKNIMPPIMRGKPFSYHYISMCMFQLASDPVELQAKLFRGFGDHSRLALLVALKEGPKTVTELVETTGLSQPNASNHLRCLRECALVRCVTEGRFARYELADRRVAKIIAMAHDLLGDIAQDIHDCVREGTPRGR